jgi:IclR family pca regulon transcriptional regulator
MAMSDVDRDHVQSLERGITVLLAFDAEHPNPSLAELAQLTGFSRPAVRRFLITLERMGYVRSSDGRWSLTPRVLLIGQHYTESHALIELAQPHLVQLAGQIHESASLATLDAGEVVYVARVPVHRIMSINVQVGTRVPAYATSMGRVLLAALEPDELDAYLARADLRPLTPRAIANADELRAELARVRSQGWALVDQELEEGLRSVAVPIRDSNRVVAAVNVSAHASRASKDTVRKVLLPPLLRTAANIEADLSRS